MLERIYVMNTLWDDSTNRLVEKGMDYSALRHGVIANNISNVNTPGFKRSDVSFDSVLKSNIAAQKSSGGLAVTNSRHMDDSSGSSLSGFVSQTDDTMLRGDMNNVDISNEMSQAAKNSVYFQTLTQIASRRFSLAKSVIRGR